MNSAILIIIIIVAVIVVAALGAAIYRLAEKKRSQRLQQRFGPEYQRAVKGSDDRRAAESELVEREKRRKKLELKTLDAGQRRQYEQRWSDIQRDFVDDPGQAVRKADRLVVDVMKARGYPVDDFDQRADDLSVDYPKVTQNYRTARDVARANERGEAGTEDMRTAMTSYRSLVEALLGGGDGPGAGRDRRPADRSDARGTRDTGPGRTNRRRAEKDGRTERTMDTTTGQEGGA